jgi:hypothetical protein
MRKLILFLILVVLAYGAFNLYMKSTSPEVKIVHGLEKEFHRSVDKYFTALRQTAEPGLVVIAEPEKAENEIREIRTKLREIMVTLTEEKAIKRARKLETEIQTFCEKNGID